jgi:predicted RNA-binding Zn-ribbon protein involved in translation (DUF1610 family)
MENKRNNTSLYNFLLIGIIIAFVPLVCCNLKTTTTGSSALTGTALPSGNPDPPALTGGLVSPTSGNQNTNFIFQVTYTDASNNAPAYIDVFINATAYPMVKLYPTDTDYLDGCIYQYTTTLAPATYTYYFTCSDGTNVNTTITYTGLTVTYLNNSPPQIFSPLVSPNIGTNTTVFNFSMIYVDADNNLPASINVTINSTTHALLQVNAADTNVVDGKAYYYTGTLSVFGNYRFEFNCSVGTYAVSTEWINGPLVDPFIGLSSAGGLQNYIQTPGYAYSWIDATTGTRCTVTNYDDGYDQLALPFTFTFYNTPYTTIYACTNGFASFAASITYYNVNFPTATQDNMIAPYWQDLITATPTNMFYLYVPSQQCFVIEWQNIETYKDNFVGTFEVVLYQNGNIVFNYQSIQYVGVVWGYPATVGLNYGLNTAYWNQYTGLTASTSSFSILYSLPSSSASPTLLSPANGATLQNGTIPFQWTSIGTHAIKFDYTWELSTTPTFSTTVFTNTSIPETATTTTWNQLVNGSAGTYYWRVQPYYGTFIGNWSSTFSFNLVHDATHPALTSGSVSPTSGIATTLFTYTVTYISAANINSSYMEVYINGTGHAMSQLYRSDTNYLDGCIFQYSTTLAPEAHPYVFTFNCSDGKYVTNIGPFTGPTVLTGHANAPTLGSYGVSPLKGNNGTTLFDFSVIYYDADNVYPLAGVANMNVTIDGVAYPLTASGGTPSTGITYYYQTTLLGLGTYTYNFTFFDGTYVVSTGNLTGPVVAPFTNFPAITLVSPANGTTDLNGTIAFTWDTPAHPWLSKVTYTWQLSSTATFSSIVFSNSSIHETTGTTTWDQLVNITSGTYYWRVCAVSGVYTGPWSGTFVIIIQHDDVDPVLSSGSVTPSSGSSTTTFTFTVTYTDADNLAPTFVRVYVNKTLYTYAMSELYTGDNDFVDGCVFYYTTTLPVAKEYTFTFNCSVGPRLASIGPYTGPTVVNSHPNAPTLNSYMVTPSVGNGGTTFNFSIIYYDADNVLPLAGNFNVTINGTVHALTAVKPADANVVDGKAYYFTTTLPTLGTYLYNFTFYDGTYVVSTGNIQGPRVEPFYGLNPITLVSPANGTVHLNGSITFTWDSLGLSWAKVTYTWQLSSASSFSSILLSNSSISETPTTTSITNNVQQPAGTYYWRVCAVNGSYTMWSGTFLITIYYNNIKPTLTGQSAFPMSGYTTTTFTFTINYTDLDNNAPTYVHVIINGTSNVMTPLYTTGVVYADGCIYQYATTLPVARNETYSFTCSDGTNVVSTPLFSGIVVTAPAHANAPYLVNPMVTPAKGSTGIFYNFSVLYFDADNVAPLGGVANSNITVNGTTYALTGSHGSPVTGETLYYRVMLTVLGTYVFNFTFSDGTYTVSTGNVTGPRVNPFYGLANLYLIAPANNSFITQGNQVFTWSTLITASGQSTYTIEISTSPSFSSFVFEQNAIHQTNGVETNLTVNVNATSFPVGTYYWRVQPNFNSYYGYWTLPFVLNVEANGTTPTLGGVQVVPQGGNSGMTYNFSVTYTDSGNAQPLYVNVVIQGASYPMVKQDPADVNYVGGCMYQFLTPLPAGTITYSFTCATSTVPVSTGNYTLSVTQLVVKQSPSPSPIPNPFNGATVGMAILIIAIGAGVGLLAFLIFYSAKNRRIHKPATKRKPTAIVGKTPASQPPASAQPDDETLNLASPVGPAKPVQLPAKTAPVPSLSATGMVTFGCPNCGASWTIPEQQFKQYKGQEIDCTACGHKFVP